MVKNSEAHLVLGSRVFNSKNVMVIAEIGNNHNGSLARAKALIDVARDCGADCVKFQLRDMEDLYGQQFSLSDKNLTVQYTVDLLQKNQLPTADLFEALDYASRQGLLPLCTPWDTKSFERLEQFGISGYKVASADLTNHELIKKISATKKPILLSTGMSTEAEILETIKLLEARFSHYVLMHCNGTYPPPLQDVNLLYIRRLQSLSGRPVGYSGHERGINVAVAAVALGAVVIEKHITLDKSLEGSDHRISLLPQQFEALVHGIREVSEALGNDSIRKLSQGEVLNRTTLAKSLFSTSNLAKGHLVTFSDLTSKSPGHGLQPNKINAVLGKRLERPIKKGEPILLSHFECDSPAKEIGEPKVGRWGLPVRFHDFMGLYELGHPQVLEFHMTYSDLNLNIQNFFAAEIDAELIVHAPELFERDHLLDLTSPDKKYRNLSIEHLQKTIDVCNHLKRFFNNRRSNIGVVTNVGGFSEEFRLDDSTCARRIDNFRDSLSKLDLCGIEILPQTMPPFPWLLGGQRIHNLFTDPGKIKAFCQEESMRICLDVSHSSLFCNCNGQSLDEFLEEVLPYTVHLHLADASGSEGEGLQIGQGNIDFKMVAEKVSRLAPGASWIPEIWQGHEDSGREFWVALNRLQAAGF